MESLVDRLEKEIWRTSDGAIVENEDAILMVNTALSEKEANSDWICTLLVLKKIPEGRVIMSSSLDGKVFLVGSIHTRVTLSAEIWGGVALVRGMPTDEFCSARIQPANS